ncbi:unnamed protein product [Oppiella nova]|uniref:CRAL-TRIO domain-containing protein n=1 Tax=Oppiella nova TaxID=334625 RepID=A0A7R9LT56_9ACAR|nr:unnamed protein product [Oppiella nova]CAG2166688.1 unnamed protein product [Oppiella nova]
MTFPTLNSREEAAKISSSMVSELRTKFLEVVAKAPELYYDKDVEKLKTNDWSLQRFLNHSKSNVDKAVECLDEAMKWRKSFGVRELNDKDFPRLTLLLDCKDSGVKNADMDFMKFAHRVLNDYYPGLVNAGLIYKLPKVMEAIYKLVKSWLNEEQEKFCYLITRKTIGEYASPQDLPDFLLGTNQEPYRTVPDGAPTAHELAERLGIKVEKADKLVKHLEPFYNE